MPVQNTLYNPEKTILITPDKQRFPVHESEKPYIVTARSFWLRKTGSGLLTLLFLVVGIYLLLSPQSQQVDGSKTEVEEAIPVTASPVGFIRVDPEKVGLPQGWERIKSADKSFDIGYNPQTMSAKAGVKKIELKGKKDDTRFLLELLPYDGGGRHEFILKKMKVIDLTGLGSDANTHEQIYDISGRRALIIYGVDYQGITVIGMMQKDQLNAFLIQASGLTQKQVEETIYTLRVL